jgi:hypothetical protein
LATASAILAAQHINLLLISQVKADFTHALPILSSSRCLGSELQVKNVPVFPAIYANSSTLGPPRQLYLLRRAATFAWLYLVNDWISFFGPQQSADEETRLYGEGREFDFSLNDWTVRVALSIVTWFVQARAWLTGMHCFSSLICAGTGLYSPDQWPPLLEECEMLTHFEISGGKSLSSLPVECMP